MNESELISKFSNIYIMLLYSIMTNDIDRVKHYLNEDVYNKYKNIVENNIKNKENQMYDELNVYKINIINKEIVENKEIITVELISRYMDYIVDSKTKQYKRGINNHRIEKKNILTFEKSKDVFDNKIVHTCPNCGANLDIHFTGICPYCKQSINLTNEDYILTNIEVLN